MNELLTGLYKKIIFLAVLVMCLILLVVIAVPRWLGPSDSLEKADVIVAISGGDTEARAREAIRLQQEGWAPKLIFSGAAKDPDSPSNAEVMRRAALEAGVAPINVDIEELGMSTIGNAKETVKIIQNEGYNKIILVTSKYHQRRASLEFKRLLGREVTVINHPAPGDKHWPSKSWWLHPDSLFLGLVETIKTTYVWLDYKVAK